MRTQKNSLSRSEIFALIAILISISSIYFSVFYQNRTISVSLIDSNVLYFGSHVNVKLLYNNQGNTYSTIIQNHLIFYQNKNQPEKSFYFNDENKTNESENDPIILMPGEQRIRTIDLETDFSENVITRQKLALKDTIFVGLLVQYINPSGRKSGDNFSIGYILINENKKIMKYRLDYNVFDLKGNNYYPGVAIE